jgi:hypothetical protein
MSNDEPLKVYEGRGETIGEALEGAAARALTDDRDGNLGAEFAILRHVVRVENPRISEHIITIGR